MAYLSTFMLMIPSSICLLKEKVLQLQSFFACLYEAKHWLASNFLTLIDSKTEVIVFGPSEHFKFNNSTLDSMSVFESKGVVFTKTWCYFR